MSQRVSLLINQKGKWVKYLEITEELWKKCIQETLFGILKMLESAERLLQSGGHEAICAGLYTFAVEEYGKLLLLKQYNPSDGKVKIEFRDIFRRHEKKFKTAIENLPHECTILYSPWKSKDWHSKDIWYSKDVIADLEARKSVFYCDFVDSGDAIKTVPRVEKTLLRKAIDSFRTILDEINI
jgi:AbiV family abortive infection protein